MCFIARYASPRYHGGMLLFVAVVCKAAAAGGSLWRGPPQKYPKRPVKYPKRPLKYPKYPTPSWEDRE